MTVQFICLATTVLSLASTVSSVTLNVDSPTTNLSQLVFNCTSQASSEDTNLTASGDGSSTSPACATLDILLHTDLQLDSPVTFPHLNHTSLEGAGRVVTLTCTSTGAGLVFHHTLHVELTNIKLVGCAVIRDYTVRRLLARKYQARSFSSALHIVETQYISINNIHILNSPGVGILLINNTGITNITDSNFTSNRLSDSSDTRLYGGGGVYLYILRTHRDDPDDPDSEASQFYFDRCTFRNNTAANTIKISYVYVDEFGDPISGRGRGGGLLVALQRNVHNVTVTVSDCHFSENAAFGGSGFAAEMEHGYARDNAITVQRSTFLHNGCQEGGTRGVGSGGGTQVSFFTLDPDTNMDNLIAFRHVTFADNCAFLGGGAYFFSNFNTDPHINNQLVFDNCTWTGNHAQTGSAIDMNPGIFERLDSGYGTVPVFRDCTFANNSIETVASSPSSSSSSSGNLKHFGTGTVYSSLHDIRFESSARFLHNFGSAVYVVNGIADFTTSSALFDGNEGIQGGGVALIGTSSMLIGPYDYTFVNNVATDRGGAIYSYLVDSHDFVVSRSCFMQYTEQERRFGIPSTQWGVPSTKWKARVHFKGNMARTRRGHDIFTTSLLPCQVVNINMTFEVLELTDIFQPPGVTFAGHVDGLRISTDGAGFARNGTERLVVAPGENFRHGVEVVDDLDQLITSTLAASFLFNRSNIELDDPTFLTNQAIQFRGRPHEEDTLVLQAVNARRIFLSIDVEMLDCPPGFVLHEDRCECDATSHLALTRCESGHLHSYLRIGYWIGYVNDTDNRQVLVSAVCPSEFCNYRPLRSNHSLEIPLSQSEEDLDGIVCGSERSGVLCGRCNLGYAVRYHSPSLQCVAGEEYCNYLGWLLYVVSEIVPATILFVVILVFNINFTSGALNGFILFSQVLDTLLIDASGVIALPENIKHAIDAIRLVYGFFNLDFFFHRRLSFCIWKEASALDMLAFKYLTIGYSVLLIAGVIVFMKYCGARCLGRYYRVSVLRSSVIQGLSTFLVMCYAQCVKVSFSLLYSGTLHLSPAEVNSSVPKRVWYNGNIEYFSIRHLPYALPALAVLLTIGFIPPVILLTYPAIFRIFKLLRVPDSYADKCSLPSTGLKPFLDAFQGSFRDDFRFFAGVYFLYRWVGVLIYSVSATYSFFYALLEVVLILILVLHALTQPYQKKWHNILDTLILLDLALINNLTAVHYFNSRVETGLSYQTNIYRTSILQLILVYLPMLYLVSYLTAQIAKRTCCRSQSVREKYLPKFLTASASKKAKRSILEDDHEDLPYRMLEERCSTTTLAISRNNSLRVKNDVL